METAFHEDQKSNTLKVRSTFCCDYQKLTRIVSCDSLRFNSLVFSMLYIIILTIDKKKKGGGGRFVGQRKEIGVYMTPAWLIAVRERMLGFIQTYYSFYKYTSIGSDASS